MMRRNLFVVAFVLVLAVMAVGCAKPPQQEIDAAKAALTAAEQAEATIYAPDAWTEANTADAAVKAELDAQQAKFALFRSYKKASELIAAAQKAADDAKAAGTANKEQAKTEATTTINDIKTAVASTTTLIADMEKCRRKPKEFKKDMELMKGNFDGLATQVAPLEAKLTAPTTNFLDLKREAEALKGQVAALTTELEAAKAKIKC